MLGIIVTIFIVPVTYCSTVADIFDDLKKGVGVLTFNSYVPSDFAKKKWTENKFGFVQGATLAGAKFKDDSRYENKDFIAFFGNYDAKKTMYWFFKSSKTTPYLKNTIKSITAGATNQKILDTIAENSFLYQTTSQVESSTTPTKPQVECFKKSREKLSSTGSSVNGENIYCEITASPEQTGLNSDVTLRTDTWRVLKGNGKVRVKESSDIQFLILAKDEVATLKCEISGSADGCAWYENGKMVSSATNYEYQHDGKDKIVQHISSGSTATWTIFTLDSFPEKSETIDIELELSTQHTFKCPTSHITTWFPVPMIQWTFKEEKVVELSPSLINPEEQLYHYQRMMSINDSGLWTCKVAYGSTLEVVLLITDVKFNLANEIKNLEGIPIHWYEYFKDEGGQNGTGAIYYFKGETPRYKCDVLKESFSSIWWHIDNDFYKESDNFLRLIDSSKPNELIELDSILEVKTADFDGSGRLVNQSITIDTVDNEKEFNVTCFILGFSDPKTFSELRSMFKDGNDVISKTLKTVVVSQTYRPVIKGPLSVIEAPNEDIRMTCYHFGSPAPYVSFHYRRSTVDTYVNITDMIVKNADEKYSRYSIERENENKTVLTIQNIDEESDAGNYSCWSINRQFGEDRIEKGPKAQLIIEERCAVGAKFCFNSTTNNAYTKCMHYVLIVLLSMLE